MAKAKKKAAAKKPAAAKPRKPAKIHAATASTTQGISKDAYDRLKKRIKGPTKEMEGLRGTVGGIVNDFVEKENLHKGAYQIDKIFDRYLKKGGVALSELLFHVDLMREHGEYDSLAAADMLEDRKEREKEAADEAKSAKVKEAAAAKAAKAAKKNGADDTGGKTEQDMKSGVVSLKDRREVRAEQAEAEATPTPLAGEMDEAEAAKFH
jgi:hypothetical protein